jgi:hypothetical protein
LDQLLVRVAEQREVQAVILLEALLRRPSIGAGAKDDCSGFRELW